MEVVRKKGGREKKKKEVVVERGDLDLKDWAAEGSCI